MSSGWDYVNSEREKFDSISASRLLVYMLCPRKFFYSHIMNWAPDMPNNHLVFGTCWHAGLESLYKSDWTDEDVENAKIEFYDNYRDIFDESTDLQYDPKTPDNGMLGLEMYAKKYEKDFDQYNVLDIEALDHIQLSDTCTLNYKCDLVLEDKKSGRIVGVDFKTSSRFTRNWGEEYTMSTQMLAYLYALQQKYPDREVQMLVRAVFFRKRKPIEFSEQVVKKTPERVQSWLNNTLEIKDRIDKDVANLDLTSPDHATMSAFPIHDNACFNYGRQCQFFTQCNSWSNPLAKAGQPPPGLRVVY